MAFRALLFTLCYLPLLPAAAVAETQSVETGQNDYEMYCATCHGLSGAGDGPLSEYLTAEVPDLTTLSERNAGVFPLRHVLDIIDGSAELRGHGGAMPVYGWVFETEAGTNDTAHTPGDLPAHERILSVARYLESLQK
ncbi:c-type cytochrome [Pacificoceanicola onchidii]|uniref:c-type cytochrome n=1 Tax=Pacificoceanicola onchidii TaxID=2562685 RepID=UPI001456138B|nr:c-type cytochrome [Pacificoceanicola onchidii]